MAKLYRLQATDSNPHICAIAIAFDEGKPAVLMQWRHGAPLSSADVHATAKECASQALAHLIKQDRGLEASLTNWPSVVAAAAHHVREWNEALRAAVYARDGVDLTARAGSDAGARVEH